tara:strand:- start:202 stop:417 length:216 start_codon:yes stop_codon:yes gene_type:complete
VAVPDSALIAQNTFAKIKAASYMELTAQACSGAGSLRWHYPDQVRWVGGIDRAALSAWISRLPLGFSFYRQ